MKLVWEPDLRCQLLASLEMEERGDRLSHPGLIGNFEERLWRNLLDASEPKDLAFRSTT